ncbi:MAG: hypothetical protein HYV07_24320 [Deltaproteobacteria bacterium]|nr:hypothetical protein [Deltaproteobacteria bacterium]
MKRTPLASLLALALLAGCRDTKPSTGTPPKADTGTTGPVLCSTTSNCGGLGICVAGVCEAVVACAGDTACGAGQVCHTTRGYCVECDGRHANECPTGQTCQFDFTCVPIGGANDAGTGDGGTCSGTCATRAECAADQVCKTGACCAPPPRCFTTEDCPASRPECNGADGRCFGGDVCTSDSDCLTKPGCSGGGCFCDPPGGAGTCRVRPNECASDADCNDATKLCTLSATPRRCITAASCTSDTQCAPDGLICDTASMRCKNGRPCPTGTECTPTTQACVAGVCVPRSCLNDPTICNSTTEVCDATGHCVPNMSGNTCTADSNCNSGYYCNTSTSRCALGCRTNTDCPNGTCGAAHQCQYGQGAVCAECDPALNGADCPAGSTCFDSPILGPLCRESCGAISGTTCMANPSASCIFGKCSCN